jgi:hypothetical protein
MNDYGLGWVFFENNGVAGNEFLPFETDNLIEWIKGFMSAQADFDYPKQYASVEAALVGNGVKGKLLTKLLEAAETALASDKSLSVPIVPLRGKSHSKAKLSVV